MEDKNGVRRESLPYPWNEISYHLIKYISCESRYNVVYGYHFRPLEELRFGADTPPQNRLSIPYSLLQSVIDISMKVQEGNHQQLAHHGLITLIMEDALQNLRIPITWAIFKDMQTKEDIKALEYDKIPTDSETDEEETEKYEEETEMDEEEQEEKEKESGEETKEDAKEETDELSEELEGEEEEKHKDERWNRKQEVEDKEKSPRESLEPTEKEAAAALTTLSTPIKKKEVDRDKLHCTLRQEKVQE